MDIDYFDYKDALGGYLLLSYFLYSLIIFVRRYLLKKKSTQIIKIPVAINTIQYILLIILTYIVTIPVFTYYFSKGVRLIYLQFVDNDDPYLRRQGFYSDDYDETRILSICIFLYLFLIIKLLLSYVSRYTIRKDNFIIISLFALMIFLGAWGNGNDIRTYSHFILTVLFLLILYFVVRNKSIKDLG